MRKGSLWKKTVSILLASAMVLTAIPVSASGFEAEEVQRIEGTMEEVPMEGKDTKEDTPEAKAGFQAEEVPEEAAFEAEVPETVQGFAAEKDMLGDVTTTDDVAAIGQTKYASLETAITAATNNAMITLIKDTVEAVTVPAGKTITLDLNGCTLQNYAEAQDNKVADAERKHTITNQGTLTITDNSAAKSGTVDNLSHGKAAIYNAKGATLTIAGGNITRSAEAGQSPTNSGGNSWYVIRNEGTIDEISGGHIFSNGYYSSLICNVGRSVSDRAEITKISGGTFDHNFVILKNDDYSKIGTISGGTFTVGEGATSTAVLLNYGTIEGITGGDFTNNGKWAVLRCANWMNKGQMSTDIVGTIENISGGTFTAAENGIALMLNNGNQENTTYTRFPSANVTGGTFTGSIAVDTEVPSENLTVTGGKFAAGSAANTVEQYLTGAYGLDEEGNVVEYAAQIGEKKYATLQDAISAATDGTTYIDLLHDIDITASNTCIPEGKTIFLDLSGHEIHAANTEEGNIDVFGKLYINDSTDKALDGTGSGKIYSDTVCVDDATAFGVIGVINNGSFTMDSGTIFASNSENPEKNGNFGVVVQNNGSVFVNGGKIEAGWYAVTGNGTYSKNTIIYIRGGHLISNADYAIYHPGNAIEKTGCRLYIDGGTVKGRVGAVAMRGGYMNIEGGSFISEGTGSTGKWQDGTSGLGHAAINIDSNYASVDVDISGGTFTAENNKPSIAVGNGTANYPVSLAITGGTYGEKIKEDYIVLGYMQNDQNTVVKMDYDVTFKVVGDAGVDVSGITAPEPQRVGHKKTAAKPYFSPKGYQILGWYKEEACTNEWKFEEAIVTKATDIYVKIAETADTTIERAIETAINGFNTYCGDTLVEGNTLKGKTLAELTKAALTEDLILALKEEDTKAKVKELIDALDAAVSTEDLTDYLSRNPKYRQEIDNLRAIQEIVFAVEAQPVPVQDKVEINKVETPDPPANTDIPSKDLEKIKDTIERQKESTVIETVEDLVYNGAVSNLAPEGLEEAAKGAVTEPSVLFVEAVLKNVALDAVVQKPEGVEDYEVSLVPKKLEFEVAPYKQKAEVDVDGKIIGADSSASPVKIPNEELKKPVTFYLPIPRSVSEQYVKAYHNNSLMGHYRIQTDEDYGDKYVAITSDSFSTYILEFTNDSGYIPPSVSYYNVTFDSQGGSAVPAINSVREYSTIAKPADPTRENFVFGGWFKDAECKEAWDFAKDTVTKDITLYAKWTAKEEPSSGIDPVVVKVDSKTTNTVKISWSESAKAEGYTVWARAEGQTSYKRVAITSKDAARTYTWKKREPGTKHFFVVKAWIKDENGRYVFSEASKTVRGTTKPETAKIKKVTVNAAGDLKVTLEGPAKGANRYAMCWSRKADFSRYAIGIRTKYTSRTMVKGQKPGTYYVKVRSYRQMGESRVYGDWSEAVVTVVK